jgi:glucose/mannose transport system substrate-binding protein
VAMPVNFHRENTLIYNKAIFAAHHLSPPATVSDLVDLCDQLKAAGVTAFATSHQGWILRIMFNAIAAGHMGGAAFRDYFTGASTDGSPKLREALTIFSGVLQSCTNPDAGEAGFNWTNAAQTLFNGDAAMILHGDWVKAYLTQLGWKPGVEFDAVAAPGTSDLFLYVADSFAIASDAKNARGARDFLALATSPEGQVGFNAIKGSSPIRSDVPLTALDRVAQATFLDLQRAQIRMPAPNSAALDEAFVRFVRDHDVDRAAVVLASFAQSMAAQPKR